MEAYHLDSTDTLEVSRHIETLLADHALEDVTDLYDPKQPRPGVFYARLFVVYQKNKSRLITDYTPVNPYLHVPKFKMDTVRILREIVSSRTFQFGASIDIKNAFPHIATREQDREALLILGPGNRVYRPLAATFGLAPIPLLWTKDSPSAPFLASPAHEGLTWHPPVEQGPVVILHQRWDQFRRDPPAHSTAPDLLLSFASVSGVYNQLPQDHSCGAPPHSLGSHLGSPQGHSLPYSRLPLLSAQQGQARAIRKDSIRLWQMASILSTLQSAHNALSYSQLQALPLLQAYNCILSQRHNLFQGSWNRPSWIQKLVLTPVGFLKFNWYAVVKAAATTVKSGARVWPPVYLREAKNELRVTRRDSDARLAQEDAPAFLAPLLDGTSNILCFLENREPAVTEVIQLAREIPPHKRLLVEWDNVDMRIKEQYYNNFRVWANIA
ncbi:hypothetical protein HDU93_006913 [Gonapodya sp. JEL0774]|nr:hypothetical protein HDU93_006913 [Gonapodya sp. JEL0774]